MQNLEKAHNKMNSTRCLLTATFTPGHFEIITKKHNVLILLKRDVTVYGDLQIKNKQVLILNGFRFCVKGSFSVSGDIFAGTLFEYENGDDKYIIRNFV